MRIAYVRRTIKSNGFLCLDDCLLKTHSKTSLFRSYKLLHASSNVLRASRHAYTHKRKYLLKHLYLNRLWSSVAGEMKSDRSFCVFLEFISGCGKLNELAGHSSFYCDEVPPSLSAIPGKSTLYIYFFFLVCYLYLFSCLVVNNIISWHTFRSQNIPVIMTLQTLTLYAKDVFFCLFSFQFTVCHFSVKCSN